MLRLQQRLQKKAAGQMTETDDELMQELLSRAESDSEEE